MSIKHAADFVEIAGYPSQTPCRVRRLFISYIFTASGKFSERYIMAR